MKAQHPSLNNLIGCERGNVLMTFGLTSLIAAAAVGGSVDFGRSYQMKSKMQNALDSAVTSGIARYRESGNWEAAKTHAAAVFQAVFSDAISPVAGQPAPTAGLDQPVVSFTQTGTQLAGTATVRANTPFMNMIIGENLLLTANSSAIPATGKMLEVALMVDLTGSMGWDAASGAASTPCNSVASPREKIDYLKCAYEDLLNIMLPTSGVNNDAVRIGVAPFADYVNAGAYASAATGLAAEGGAYAKISNLASTRQRSTFSGTYSGYTAGTGTGNGYGAMGQTAASGSTTTAAGATYTSGHCANPGGTAATMWTRDSLTYGVYVPIASNNSYTGSAPTGLMKASSGSSYARANRWNMTYGAHYSYSDNLYWYSQTSSGYYAPMVANSSQLTIQTNDADGHQGNVGVGVYYTGSSNDPTVPAYLKKNTSGFWRVTGIKSDGTFSMVWDDDQSSSEYTYYLPIYTSHTTAATSGCESRRRNQAVEQADLLRHRAPERHRLDYTATTLPPRAATSAPTITAIRRSRTTAPTASATVGGRELPSVIPLTNSRTTLENFFQRHGRRRDAGPPRHGLGVVPAVAGLVDGLAERQRSGCLHQHGREEGCDPDDGRRVQHAVLDGWRLVQHLGEAGADALQADAGQRHQGLHGRLRLRGQRHAADHQRRGHDGHRSYDAAAGTSATSRRRPSIPWRSAQAPTPATTSPTTASPCAQAFKNIANRCRRSSRGKARLTN